MKKMMSVLLLLSLGSIQVFAKNYNGMVSCDCQEWKYIERDESVLAPVKRISTVLELTPEFREETKTFPRRALGFYFATVRPSFFTGVNEHFLSEDNKKTIQFVTETCKNDAEQDAGLVSCGVSITFPIQGTQRSPM